MNRALLALGCLLMVCSAACGGGGGMEFAPMSQAGRVLDSVGPSPADLSAGIEVIQPDNDWDDPEEGVVMRFTDVNPGDYNLDGWADGRDLFLLAARFGQRSGHAGGEAETEGNDCIDGNRDGVLDGADLFPLTTNYLSRITSWVPAASATPDGDRTLLYDFSVAYRGCFRQREIAVTKPDLPAHYTVLARSSTDTMAVPAASYYIVDDWPPFWRDKVGIRDTVSMDGAVKVFPAEAIESISGETRYEIWYDTESPIRFDGGAIRLTGAEFEDFRYGYGVVQGLTNGVPYHFAVRTRDEATPPNRDGNTVEMTETPHDWRFTFTKAPADYRDNAVLSKALLPSRYPALAYRTYNPTHLKYAEFDGARWIAETAAEDVKYSDDFPMEIVVDQAGNPGLLYVTGSVYQLRYAHREGGTWTSEQVIQDSNLRKYRVGNLEIDGDGGVAFPLAVPYVGDPSYPGGLPPDWYHVRLAVRDGSGWSIEPVREETGEFFRCEPALTLSPAGSLYLASFEGSSHGPLWLCRRENGEWSEELVNEWVSRDSDYDDLRLVVDSNENPHLFFSRNHFFKRDGEWVSEYTGGVKGALYSDQYGLCTFNDMNRTVFPEANRHRLYFNRLKGGRWFYAEEGFSVGDPIRDGVIDNVDGKPRAFLYNSVKNEISICYLPY